MTAIHRNPVRVVAAGALLFCIPFTGLCLDNYLDNLPTSVGQKLSSQLVDYFGTSQPRDIPGLAPSTDWTEPDNWPDFYAYGDKRLPIKLDGRGSSRTPLNRSWNYVARYGEWQKGLLIGGGWRLGRWFSIDVRLDGEEVLGLWFYRNKRLFTFYYRDKDSGEFHWATFDSDGSRVGSMVRGRDEAKTLESVCEWQGTRMTEHEFEKASMELFNAIERRLKAAEPDEATETRTPVLNMERVDFSSLHGLRATPHRWARRTQ